MWKEKVGLLREKLRRYFPARYSGNLLNDFVPETLENSHTITRLSAREECIQVIIVYFGLPDYLSQIVMVVTP
jgi:hypothetical protein